MSSAINTMSSVASRKRRSDTTMVDNHSSSNEINNNENENKIAGTSTTSQDASNNLEQPKVQTTLKVHIQRFHGVAQWSWNANDDVCGICQSAFEGTAPGVNLPGDHSPVVWGRCLHAFHLQCVSKWLQSANSKNSCPICRQEWEFGENPVSKNDTVAAPVPAAVPVGSGATNATAITVPGGD
jgi:anaphase-promoting complex subunit 11